MAGRDRDGAIRKKLPIVDLYFPTADMNQLPRWISEMRPELVNSPDIAEDYLKLTPQYHSKKQAFVTIQTGCNKFCTYCVVPFARGLEKNRPVRDIIDEVRALAEGGCVEVTLLGQTVNSYRAPDPEHWSPENPYVRRSLGSARDDRGDHFAALLWEVNQVPGISRLHFTAPHPLHMTDEVMDAMQLPAHLNYLHLPVQAGDNEVLRRMNRRYTREQYLECVHRLYEKIPNVALGTDIIVGFCGETAEQFERTVDLYREANFDISYTAMYSPRSGTAAYRAFKDDVSKEEKKRRWQVLQDLMEKIVKEKNQAYVGKTVSVFVERHDPPKLTDEMLAMPGNVRDALAKLPGTCSGNSREMKLVQFSGSAELVGQIVDVHINEAKEWVLIGNKK
jgi:tRNA-2-methylthio-N6-dimethylallyladenosine synthase